MARQFALALVRWQAVHGRHGLPWQGTRDPYRVWLSEIMLQQTQVATAIPYYARFLEHFPDVRSLAAAPASRVLELWAGLGYYARARHAHACAQAVVRDHGGRFPTSAAQLARLPGIGDSTAAAIAAFCFGEAAAILDANVKRVLARYHAVDGDVRRAPVREALWSHARDALPPPRHMPAYTQAIMDLGATVCTRTQPRCGACPVRAGCAAHAQGRTGQLPTRVTAPARAQRRAHFLVALHRGAVLVEQRPDKGIWGGLLALPQFDTAAALRRAARPLGAVPATALPPRRHAFTHFTLTFTAHVLRPAGPRPAPPAAGQRWLPLARVESAALPAPLRALLRALR